MLGEDFPLEVGDVGETAMLSLCAAGLVRTWTDKGTRLWQVQQAEILHGADTVHRDLLARQRAVLSSELCAGTQ